MKKLALMLSIFLIGSAAYSETRIIRTYQSMPYMGIKGRPVASIEEARASIIDFDGSIFYFPDLANKRIYTKQINMDGTALLQVVAVIFLTQAYGVVLTPFMIVQIALLAIVASSTCAGIPGAGIITIALVLNGLGLSPEQMVAGFAFLIAIERITDMMRTLVNVTSDAVVAAAIADNENEINYDLLNNPDEYNDVIN